MKKKLCYLLTIYAPKGNDPISDYLSDTPFPTFTKGENIFFDMADHQEVRVKEIFHKIWETGNLVNFHTIISTEEI